MEGSLWLTLMATCMVLKYSHSISDYEEGLPFDLGCGNSMDIALMLDTTTNNPSQYDEFRKFLTDLVDEFQIDSGKVRVALVTFSSQPVLHFRLDKYTNKNDIKSAIRNAMFTPGERNFADAFDMLRRQVFFGPFGDRLDAPNIVILITSGNSQRKEIEAAQQALTLKDQASILVIPKGVSNLKEIQSFASDPYLENTYELGASENISLIKDLVYVGICSITTDNAYDNEEFEGSAVSSTGSNKTDLAILLHYSDTTPKKEFDAIQQFLHDLLANVNVDNDNVRVSLALYGRDTNVQFDFNAYKQNKKKLLNALLVDYFDGRSQEANLAGALDFARTSMFLEAYGDRLDVPNTLLVISNKNSDGKYVPAFQQSLSELKNTNITVIGVGLNLYDVDEVNALSKSPAFSFILNDASQLSVVLKDIQKRLPSITPIETTPAAPPIVFYEEPIHNVSIEAGIESNVKADITVVFHASHKTKAKLFKNSLLNFISSLFAKAAVDSGDVKVALVNYGVTGTVLFNFNKYTQKSELRKAIRKTSGKVRNSNANLGDALHLIRTKLFTKQEGFRVDEGVPSAIILITDLPSSISSYSVEDEISRLKRDFKTSVFTVGIDKADLKELQTITSTPTRDYFQSVTKYQDLMANKDILANVRNGIYPLQGKAAKTSKPTSIRGQNTEPWIAPTLNLAVLFQSHGKTNPTDFYKRLLPFMGNLIQYPDLSKHRTDVALINYGKTVNIVKQFKGSISLNETKNILLGLSKTLRSKSAILCKALDEALTSFQKLDNVALASNQIVIITDTQTTDNCTAVIDKLHSSDFVVQAIQVKATEDSELKLITDPKEGGFLLSVKSYEDLNTQSHILDAVAQNIIHNVETKTLRSKTLSNIDGEKGRPAKIVILLHASTNVSKRDFKRQFLKYVLKLVKKAKIGLNDVRVSLIAYGDKPYVVFNFNDHLDKKTLLRAIKKTPKKLRFDSADLGKGIASARLIFDNDKSLQGEQILVIVTDMNPTGDHSVLQSEVSKAKHEGIQISVVSVAISNTTILKNVASRPTLKHFYNVKTYIDLQIYQKSGKPVIRNIPFLRKKKQTKPKPPVFATSTMTPWPTADKFLATTNGIKHIFESKSTPKMKITTPFQMNKTNKIEILDISSRSNFSDYPRVNPLITSTASTDYQRITDQSAIKHMYTIDDLENNISTIPYDVYYTENYKDKIKLTQTSRNISVNTTEISGMTVNPDIAVPEDHTPPQLKTSTLPTNWNIITRRDHLKTDRLSHITRNPTNNKIDEDGYQNGAFSTTYASASKGYGTYEHLNEGKKVVKNFTESLDISPTIESTVDFFNEYTHTNGNINLKDNTDWLEKTNDSIKSSTGENVMERAACFFFDAAFTIPTGADHRNSKVTFQNLTEKLIASIERTVRDGNICESIKTVVNSIKLTPRVKNALNISELKNENEKLLFVLFVDYFCNLQASILNFSAKMDANFTKTIRDAYGQETSGSKLVSRSQLPGMVVNGENLRSIQKHLQLLKNLPYLSSNEFLQNTSNFLVLPYRCKDLLKLKTQNRDLLRNGQKAQIVFAFHVSSSILQSEANLLKQFYTDILRKGDIESGNLKVAIIGYGDVATTYADFSRSMSRNDLISTFDYAIDKEKNSVGNRNVNAASVFDEVSRILQAGNNTPKALIFFTDQQSNDIANLADNVMKKKLEDEQLVEIFSIAVGTNSKDEPAALASTPENVFSVSEYSSLPRISEEFVQRLRIFRSLTEVSIPDLKDAMISTTPPQQKYGCGFKNVDLVFIVDSSTSVGPDNFKKILDFLKDFLGKSNIDSGSVRVGVLSYSSEVHDHFYLNSYQTSRDMFGAIDNIPWIYGSTNTADALRDMRTKYFSYRNGDRPDARNIAFIITDGVSNINQNRLEGEVNLARQDGIEIYAVGIGLSDDTEINLIASSPPSEHVFSVRNFDELGNLDERIFESLCPSSTTILTRPPTTTSTTTFPVTRRRITTTTVATTTERTTGYDVVLVLDSSVDRSTFNFMKSYAKDLVDKLSIDNNEYRVGVMRYSTNPDVQFNLDRYDQKNFIKNRIDNIQYRWGRTNTDRALDAVRQRMFTPPNGDRDYARNLIVHITGNDESSDIYDTWAAAERAERDDINIYTVGINLGDLTEINELSTYPLSTYRTLINTTMGRPRIDDSLLGLVRTIDDSVEPLRLRPKRTTTTSTTPPTTTPRTTGKDVIFMLDSSVPPQIFNWMKSYVSNMVKKMSIDDEEYKVGLMKFGTYQTPEAHLNANRDKDDVLRKVDRMRYSPGRTNTDGAIDYVRRSMFTSNNGDRNFARNIVILLTSNEKSYNTERTLDAAERAEETGINFFTVGINLNDADEIDEISTHPLSTYRHLVNTNMNSQMMDDSSNEILRLVTEVIEPPRKRIRPTTSPTTTTSTTQLPLVGQDIVVVMDSSVKPGQFRTFKTFVQRLAENLNIDSGEVRLGLVSYSTRPSLQWNLRDFNRKDQIINRAERIAYNAGQRNTADAINFARTRMFVRSNGDRSYARNFIILLTGEKESLDRYDAYEAAYEAERGGINLFTIGYNLDDTAEISEISTYPLRTYRHLVSEESELLELPGVLQYALNDMGENPEPARQRPKRPTTLPPPITTRKPGDCKGKGDVVFILDTSGSVGRDGFYKVLNFTNQAIADLDIDSGNFRVAVITFSNWPRLEFDLSDYTTQSEIEKALTRVEYVYGNTNTASALRMAREQVFVQTRGDRVGAPNVVISITDGESNVNADDTIPEALLLKRTGTTLLTVAVGYTHREEELIGLTSPPVKENLFRVENFDALHNFGSRLVNPLCNDANKCASKPCQNGAFCIDGIGSYQCVCTNGFHGQNCDKKCGDPADVVFVMDSSEGIGEYTFRRIKGYVDYLVRQMNVEECDIRVGAMKYSSSPMVQFNIGQYQDTNTITRMVDHIGYTKGRANMAGAFRSLRTNMFNGNGDRPNVKNVAYLITDGSVGVNEDITLQEAELAIESNIQIIPIAIQMRRREEIENIALSQGLKTMEIDDETQLYSMKDDVLEPIYESVDYCADSPCRNGGQCKNNNGGFLCECRAGFSGDVCQKRCPSTGDIVFVVDASRHVNRKELRDMRKFIKQLVRRMTFRKSGFRVGVVQFAGSALVLLDLHKGSRKKAVMSAVSGIRRSGSDPMPMEALRKTRLRIFGQAGDRNDVPNSVIFITKSMRKESEIMGEAGKLKLEGTSIIGIGMDLSDSDKNFLKTAVSPPMVANAFFLPDGETLTSLTDTIMSYLCNENTACSDNPCQNNGTCTSLSSTEYTCSCTKGYAGKNCEEVNGNVADIAFLVDASGSVGLDNVDKMKEFVYSVVEKLSIGRTDDRVGLVSYSSDPQLGFHLDSFFTKKDIINAISAMQYRYGSTNTAAGLKMVRQEIFNIKNGDRSNVPNTLIMITDGNSNVNSIDTIPEAIRLREAGVHIFVIAINFAGDMYRQEMDDIASQPPDQNVFWVNSFSELPEVGSAVFNKLSSPDMNKDICDTNEIKCKHGGRCVAAAVTGSFRCECIQGFTGEYCEIACPSRFDVAFVIDSSASVGPHNFGLIRNFTSSVVEKLYKISRNNKFALITFNSEANVAFSFGRNPDLDGLKSAIAGVRYKPGGTNTALALKTAHGLLQNDFGARRSAKDVVILVTDEASNIDAQETLPAAKELKDAGTHVIAIGIDLDTAGRAAAQEVKDIASSDDRAMIKLNSYTALKGIESDVINQMCEFGKNGRK